MAERPPDPPTGAMWGLAGPQGTRDPRADTVAAERDRYREALRAIRGPEDSGPWMDVYRLAGGGYEGLQAIAREALDG